MNEGYIKLHRQILDSEVFASQKMLKIWVWCLCKANHKINFVPIKKGKGEMTVKLKRGEFLFGRFKAEEELFIDGSTIYKIMKKLEQLGNILIKSNNHYSIVTICNYNQYQDAKESKVTAKEQLTDSKVTAKSQLSNTDKKEENVNNVNNEKNKELFDKFRKLYPGTKRGNKTEFEYFIKHKDWREILPLLLPAIESQIKYRSKIPSGTFIPEWKNLKTWINNRCWEEEIQEKNNDWFEERAKKLRDEQ